MLCSSDATLKVESLPLVSVVIPAFNASRTLQETLVSVSLQTYANLEIIVVDDGSVDDTVAIAAAHAQIDPRVRYICKPNGGVASARNVGIKACSGEFVAFIDADDLWHPTKIEKQTAVLVAGGSEMALVYSPFRRIDTENKVLSSGRNHRVEGWVVNRHFYVNMIGNGSSILARKSVLEEIGGYSSALRDAGAQGCEDLLLQLRIALRYRFGTVQEYLLGYRESPSNMSADKEQMLRSGLLALTMALAECPNFSELSKRGLVGTTAWEYLKITSQRGRLRSGLRFIWPYVKGQKISFAKAMGNDILTKAKSLSRLIRALPSRLINPVPRQMGRDFYDYDPTKMYFEADPKSEAQEKRDDILRALRALAPLDALYRPEKYFAVKMQTPEFAPDIIALAVHQKPLPWSATEGSR